MTSEYFIRRGEQTFGPVAAEQLRSNVVEGKVLASDEVSHQRGGPWQSIGSVPAIASLFSEPGAPPQLPPLPVDSGETSHRLVTCEDCGQQISRRAPACPHCGAPKHASASNQTSNSHPQNTGPPVVPSTPPLNTGLQPRSYLGVASQIFGLTSLPFGLLWAWLFSLQMGLSFGHVLRVGIPAGLVFGLLMGLILGAFLRGVTITVAVRGRDQFLTRINIAMSQIGYNPATESADFLTFKPSFQAGLMSGRISVVIQGSTATIVGAATHVKKLKKALG